MERNSTILHRRINITLPEATIRMMDRVAKKGDKSRLINEAVRHFLQEVTRSQLKKQLKEAALKRAERDRRFADEWFLLE